MTSDTKSRGFSIFLMILCAFLWSTGGFFIKSVEWPPLAIAGGRSLIANIFLFLVIRKIKPPKSADQIFLALSYSLTVILFVTATKLTTAANAVLLQFTAPIYVAILGPFLLKERTTRLDIVTLIVVVIGITLFFRDKVSLDGMKGNVIALLSGVTFSLFVILIKRNANENLLNSVFWGNALTVVLTSPHLLSPWPPMKGLMALSFLGVFQLGLSYLIYTRAAPQLKALDTIFILLLEPILNPLWVFLLMGEAPSPSAIFGGFVIIAAITVRNVVLTARARL